MNASLSPVKPEQRMTCVTESARRNALTAVDSQTTYIIGIPSGIRGVGKSSIAVLLAAARHRHGLHVGLFDADSTGANILGMFCVHPRAERRR